MTANPSQQIIEAIAPQLQTGAVQHDSTGTWEWRGSLYEQRVRVRAERTSCQVQVDAKNPFGAFGLQWGPKLVPDPTAIDDAAFDVADEVRVWVGRNVVLQCFGLELPEQLAALRAFPAEGVRYLVEGMQRDHVRVLGVERDQLLGFVAIDNPDVIAATVRFTNLLAWTAAQLAPLAASAPAAIAAAKAPSATTPIRCRYCKALFLLDARAQCPQCGAPAGS
ncbi:MAG: hypothetical protein U0353_35535 [Sandaracinus sp.]